MKQLIWLDSLSMLNQVSQKEVLLFELIIWEKWFLNSYKIIFTQKKNFSVSFIKFEQLVGKILKKT